MEAPRSLALARIFMMLAGGRSTAPPRCDPPSSMMTVDMKPNSQYPLQPFLSAL
jgi:hypothetical protein